MADSSDKPDKILVSNDRIFNRGAGCWNCKHCESGKAFWTHKRQQDLASALRISQGSPLGEEHPKVINIRKMVDTIDHSIAAGALVRCTGKGMTAHNEPVGDLVAHNYMCHKWTGAQGASIARAGGKMDELPEELVDKLDGAPPKPN